MSNFSKLKSAVLTALSGHTALTMFSTFLFLLAVNARNGFSGAIILFISAILFLAVYEYGEKEIDMKIVNGIPCAVHFHASVVPIFIITFGVSVAPAKSSKIYFILATLICVGFITKALINTIANRAIAAKARDSKPIV